MTKEIYIESGNHWINAPYPLKPNDTEVKMYQQHLLTGTTLLLGSTVPLLPLCDEAIDLTPRIQDPKIIKGDWNNIEKFYDNIIGDGVLNLEGEKIIENLRPKCHRFISRVFSRKFSYMKYATFFYKDFHNATKIAEINESCPIFIWKFTN
jgi:hypothetical protein